MTRKICSDSDDAEGDEPCSKKQNKLWGWGGGRLRSTIQSPEWYFE